MLTKGAIAWDVKQPYVVEEIDIGEPHFGEVRVRLVSSGLCHSDLHIADGDLPVAFFPVLGGHEGAGIIDAVGEGVTDVVEGDHVVLAFIPSCGKCHPCTTGKQNLCDLGAHLLDGQSISDGSYRIHVKGRPVVPCCALGTFAPYVTVHQASVVRIEKDLPLDKAALVGCGVTTGWGSAVHVADTRPGETVVVVGTGGVGINAVQGAAAAGARRVIAVDPSEFKREHAIAFGATHTFSTLEEALEPIRELTWGRLADKVIITVGQITGDHVTTAVETIGKGGTVALTSMGSGSAEDVKLKLYELALLQKSIKGGIFGGTSPRTEIPWLLDMYRDGKLKLDELVTRRYRLEEVNQGYEDLIAGKNIRGVITYDDNDW
jgi:NDMA-dependent alcohol dehydrogenase